MAKVFITHSNPTIDYSPASKFGPLRPVFDHTTGPSGFHNKEASQEIMDRVDVAAASFDPDEDFLLMSGNPVIMGLVFHKFYAKKGLVCCLQWDRHTSKYIIFTVTEG